MAKELSPIVSMTEIYPSSRDSSYQNLSFPQHVQHFQKSRSSDEEAVGTEYSRSEASASKVKPNPNIVTWDGPNDLSNPKNWTHRKKWIVTFIFSAYAFISPLSSSMIAPALDQIGGDLRIPNGLQSQMVLSIFVLAYAFGPFVLSPSSEIWGRISVIRYGNLVFIFKLACGSVRTKDELIAFRFRAGLGGTQHLGWALEYFQTAGFRKQGRGMSVYQLAPVLGPAISPITGGFIVQHTTWRWAFWSLACFNAVIQLAGLFFLNESYAPTILAVKAKKLRQVTGNTALQIKWESEGRTLSYLLRISLTRPWRLLATQPIIQVLALYQAYNFGMLYLFISSFPALWIGAFLFASGSMISYQCIQLYLVDTYTRYAASASAASAFLRSLAAFGFPLFVPCLFASPGRQMVGMHNRECFRA